MPQSDSGSDSEFASFVPDSFSPSAPVTYSGGDASQNPNDPLQQRKNQFGLLGLYGDNGNAAGQFNLGGGFAAGPNNMTKAGPYNEGADGLQWTPEFGFGGLSSGPASNTESGGSQYHDVNFGDLGFAAGDPFLASIGYKGGNPYNDASIGQQSEGGPTAQGAYTGYTPEFKNFLQNGGLNLQMGGRPGDTNFYAGAFDKSGNKVGGNYAQQFDPDSQFNLAVMAAIGAAGGAAGGQLASSAGYSSGAVNAAATGAGAGFSSGLANSSGEIGAGLKGGAVGGATGGLVGAINPAASMGIDNPDLLRGVNNAAGSAVRAGLQGQNIGQAVLGSGLKSGLGYGMQTGANAIMGDDEQFGGGGGNYSTTPDMQQPSFMSAFGGGANGPYSSNAPTMNATNNDPYGLAGSQPQPDQQTPQQKQQGATNPVMDFSKKLLQGFGGSNATPQNFDNMAGNLMQLWQSHQNAKQYGGLANNLSSLYSPNSPYAQQLNQALTRSDAAAGRRSQVGPRNVELQARLADLNSRNAPELARLYGSQQNNQAQQLQSLLRMGMNPMMSNGIGSIFGMGNGGQPSMGMPSSYNTDTGTAYAPSANYGPGMYGD